MRNGLGLTAPASAAKIVTTVFFNINQRERTGQSKESSEDSGCGRHIRRGERVGLFRFHGCMAERFVVRWISMVGPSNAWSDGPVHRLSGRVLLFGIRHKRVTCATNFKHR